MGVVCLTKKKWLTCKFGEFDLQDHHEFLKFRGHVILASPTLVDLENFLYEITSKLDMFETQDYRFVNALTSKLTRRPAETNLA